MLSVAASRLGFKTCVFEPGADCPASHVSNYHFQAAYEDEDALRRAFRADGTDTVLAGWTPLGMFELQRKRDRWPLTALI